MSGGFSCAGALPGLVAGLDRAVGASTEAAVTAGAVASLREHLADATLLEPRQRTCSADGYARHLLHADRAGRYSVWAMVWRPGQASAIHDHACWCVLGIHEGALVETAYRRSRPGIVEPLKSVRRGIGDTGALLPGMEDIHRIANAGGEKTISIHVYGFDPARRPSSVGRCYPPAVRPPDLRTPGMSEPLRGS